MAKASFAMGCFWRPEVIFRRVPGVLDTTVGYSGGHVANPSYRQVCAGDTGHAETVQVEYDPDQVGYADLLRVFWNNHNPTTRDRQGPDVGSQYRSAIFCHDDEQLQAARASRDELERAGAYDAPIVTEIEPAGPFYPAEDYHQRYLEKQGAV